MTYRVEHYREEFLEDHYRIGAQLYNQWPMGGQTKLEQLRKTYNAPDFDPETRLYAFDENGAMVGFITCALIERQEGELQKAYFEWPYVLPKHELEAEPLLINKAMDVMKAKGVDILLTRAGDYWGHTRDHVETYGFQYTSDIALQGKLNFDELHDGILNPQNVEKYVPEKHEEALRDLYTNVFQLSPAQVEAQLNVVSDIQPGVWTLNPWDIKYFWVSNAVVVSENEIVGRVTAIHNPNFGGDSCNLMMLWFKDDNESVKKQLLGQLKHDCQEFGLTEILLHGGQWGFPPHTQDMWEKQGVRFRRKLAFYEKKL